MIMENIQKQIFLLKAEIKSLKNKNQNLEDSIKGIKLRNTRVEADKIWETSSTRNTFIAISTYVTILIFLILINDSNPFLHALIPVFGYILSTATYGMVKSWWLSKYRK
jgi:hypothetical protein